MAPARAPWRDLLVGPFKLEWKDWQLYYENALLVRIFAHGVKKPNLIKPYAERVHPIKYSRYWQFWARSMIDFQGKNQ